MTGDRDHTGRETPPGNEAVGEITQLLRRSNLGAEGSDKVYELVYRDLRGLAHRRLRSERDGHTLSTTALVNELFLRLAGGAPVAWQNRVHFFAVSARAMRRILVDYARSRNRNKRGGGADHMAFEDAAFLPRERADELLQLDDALRGLEQRSERLAKVVECRYFAGMSIEDTAEAMGVSTMTVKRDWTKAKAFLAREMQRDLQPPA